MAATAALLLSSTTGVAVSVGSEAGPPCPWVGSSATPQVRAAQVLRQMTTAEKLSMTHGSPVGGYAGVVAAIPRLCIPQLNLQDGGAGVTMGGTTALPAPIAAAATFDDDLARAYGAVVGQEAATKGVSINLGPNVNLARDPRGGRGFEGSGEDPYLAGAVATGYVEGVQAQHVMADVKHFVANDTEQNRNNGNAIVDERTVNELYFPPFKRAIQDGGAATVMSATGLLNGTHGNEDPYLIKQTLKQDWGFEGAVVTDWDGARSTVPAANAELDLTMPTAGNFGEPLTQAVAAGQVSMNTLNDKIERLLTEEFRYGLFDRPAGSPGANASTPEHVRTARDIAAAGTVLMKNDHAALPLDPAGTPTVAVIGEAGGSAPITGGGGSSHVPADPSTVISPVRGIAERLGATGKVDYLTGGWQVTAFARAGSGDGESRMVDNDLSTRWSSGVPMAPGQSITVDLGASRELDQITMDSGSSTTDYARGYKVYLASDGQDWGEPVATGTGTGPVIRAGFTRQTARRIKIEQTGSASSWWSIAEFTASVKNGAGDEVQLNRPTPLHVPGITEQLPTVPAARFSTAAGSPGLTASYFNNLDLTGSPALTRTEPNIDAHYTEGPGPGVNPAGFSVRWTGYLTVPVTGTYTFSLKNTGGVRMWIDGNPVFQNWAQYGPGVSAIKLTGGQRLPIKVENYQPVNGPTGPVAGTPTTPAANGSITLGWQQPNTAAIAAVAEAAKQASVAIVVVNDTQSEDGDRQNLTLAGAQDELVEAVARANPHTVVVLNTGGPVLMPWLGQVPAVVQSWYGGQQNGTALASVLFGDVNPSGKLPQTWPATMSQLPTADPSRYPGDVDVATNTTNYHYSEGLQVGYRWYDTQRLTPLFPFGFGLSYSAFAYSDLQVTPGKATAPGPIAVSATVRNTGSRSATDIAQLYVGFPAGSGEPPTQLKGFRRVTLEPGESKRVTFTLTPDDLRVWDTKAHTWSTMPGRYTINVGNSSRSLPLHDTYLLHTSAGSRTVKLTASHPFAPGRPTAVRQTLTAGGNQILKSVKLGLDLPPGWTARATTPITYAQVAPGTGLAATWEVTPPVTDELTLRRLVGTATWSPGTTTSGALQVAVAPVVQARITSAATTVRPGSTVTATLDLHNTTAQRVALSPTLSPTAGVTVDEAQIPATLDPGAAVSIPLQLTLSESARSFQLTLTGTIAVGNQILPIGDAFLRRPLVLKSLADDFSNNGTSDDADPGRANFDGSGYSYSAQALALAGLTPGAPVKVGPAQFTWPDVQPGSPNNVIAAGQAVAVRGSGSSLHILGAASNGSGSGVATIHYTDGTSTQFTLALTNWTNTSAGQGDELVATAPYWNRPAGSPYPADLPVSVFATSTPLESGKTIDYVQLPSAVTGTQSGTQLHLFDMTLG